MTLKIANAWLTYFCILLCIIMNLLLFLSSDWLIFSTRFLNLFSVSLWRRATLETLDFTICIGSTPTFLYFDLYLYSAYAAHYGYFSLYRVHWARLFVIFYANSHLFMAVSTISVHNGSNNAFIPNAITRRDIMLGKWPNNFWISQLINTIKQNMMMLVNGPRTTREISCLVWSNVFW